MWTTAEENWIKQVLTKAVDTLTRLGSLKHAESETTHGP